MFCFFNTIHKSNFHLLILCAESLVNVPLAKIKISKFRLVVIARRKEDEEGKRCKWVQLSAGQLIFCTFLVFKIHFSNSFRGSVYTMLKLKQTKRIKKKQKTRVREWTAGGGFWKVWKLNLKLEWNRLIYVSAAHQLIYIRKTSTSNATMKHSNYFTLRENSFACNR